MRGYLTPTDSADGADLSRLAPWEAQAVDAVGIIIEFWGFKRNQGRVWALLYLRGRPLSAGELQDELGLSKGAVSMITRELEQWGVIHRIRTPRSRAWRFEAEQDLMAMVRRVVESREQTVISRVRTDLANAEAAAALSGRPADAERVAKMRQVADLVDVSVSLFLQTAHLDLLEAVNALRISAPEAAADDTAEEPSEDTAATEQA